MPSKKVEVKTLLFVKSQEIQLSELIKVQIERIKNVSGDFRQNEIIEKWREIAQSFGKKTIQLFSFEATVSSGTYIRTLAKDIGEELGVGAIALNIRRTEVGKFSL